MSEPSATEASYIFWHEFKDAKQAIQQKIDSASTISQSDLAQYFNNILQSINTLEKKLTEATEYIPSYDERQYSRQIKELNDALETAKNTLMPKPKFSFRSRKKLAVKDQKREEPQPPAVEKAKDERTNNGGSVPDMFANATSFADMSNQIVRLDDSQDKGTTDVLLSNLSRCIVLLTGRRISALHIKNLKECLVVCGAIQGSILTYGFTDSTIAIACHQFRMHDARNLRILLHVTSHPIIEDCTGIAVGPYKDTTAEGSNYYNCMEDFNWLRKQASPNWKVMEEEDAQSVNAQVKEIAEHPDINMLEKVLPFTLSTLKKLCIRSSLGQKHAK